MEPKRKKVRPKADQGIGLWHGREERIPSLDDRSL